MDFEVRAAHCIEDMDRETWDGFSSGRPFASHGWYRYGERAMPGCPPLYVSVFRRGEMIARASFWLVRDEPLPLPARLLRAGLRRFLAARPLLVCRSPLADASGLILPAAPHRQAALERILAAAEEFGRSAKASFLVFDYLDPRQAGLADWQAHFMQVQFSEPGTRLALVWDSFEDYLRGLSKPAWKDYRRQLNQARRNDLEVTTRPAADLDIEEALPLIRGVETRHGAPPKPWARTMLANASLNGATWIEARSKGRLAGCGLLLADGDARLATLLGLDYSVPYVYFQLMYAAIREAIAQGARLLRAGSGAYAFKHRLGFETEPNNQLRFAGQTRLLGQIGRLVAALA
jgi:predicted N-acyltransferase